jgi:5-formyltetrahydrofolate cyclo-ligase
MDKVQMRARMREMLRNLGAEELASRSLAAADRFRRTAAWAEMEWLFSFLSMPAEILTDALLSAARRGGRRVAVPLIEGGEIRFVEMPAGALTPPRDRGGIPVPDSSWAPVEPAAAGRILVSVPGLAFDRAGNRLGRGQGYYDRFLARARAADARLVVIGICFSEQLVDEVPHTGSDQRVDGVVTDTEIVLVSPSHP